MPRGNKRRDDGRVKATVYLGIGEDGKRKYKYVYGSTAKEAAVKAEELRAKLHKGVDIASGDKPFSFWSSRFLATKETEVCQAYFVGIRSRVNFWNDAIGDMPISKITISDLQIELDDLARKNKRTGRPTSAKTLKEYTITAGCIFESAIRDRCLTYNPAKYLSISRNAPKDYRRALTEEEQRWITDTPHRAQTAAMIMMYAGLRRGELLALRVGDINLKERTITVDKSVEMDGSGAPMVKRGGKTKSATRSIDIPSVLVDYLSRTLDIRSPLAIVCPNKQGGFMSSSAFRSMWKSYLSVLNEKYGQMPGMTRSRFEPGGIPMTIPNITPHWLRHTFATILYMAGVDVLTAKEQLGHSDIATTLSIYTHLDATYKRKSMSKLDDYLKACGSNAGQ